MSDRDRAFRRREGGVVSVVVALVSLVLLGTAALAVDMGNAYSRKRQVQTEADLAALAGGAKLPAGTSAAKAAAVSSVLDYLQRNATYGQPATTWSAAQLQDGNTANGEVVFENANRMQVTAPPARVDFGLAGVLGFSSTDVAARATVAIRSPGVLMPMWLPSSCTVGPVLGDTGSNGSSPSGSTFVPPDTDGQLTVSANPTTVAYGSSTKVAVHLDRLDKGVNSATVAFTYDSTGPVNYPVTFSKTSTTNDSRDVSITVGTNVSNTAGLWQLWGVVAGKYTKDSVPFVVGDAGTLGCSASQRGNFGQLDSPRVTGENKQTRYALNLALGVDHSFQPYPAPLPVGGVCGSSLPAQLDDNPARDGRNCLNADSGNDGPGLTGGLLAGVNGNPGRLATRPNGSCGRAPISYPGVTSAPINNDVLSCFLPPGYTTGRIASSIGPSTPRGILDPAIFDSPRFVWVPVTGCDDRSCKGQLAISTFASCFLTDEGLNAKRNSSDASPTNGVILNNGGQQISSVQLLCFDPAALPETTTSTSGGMPYLGTGTRIVSLVE